MANHTEYYGLIKPTEDELQKVSDLNDNMDIIDDELHKRGKTINGEGPDAEGNYLVNDVKFAHQIVTEDAQQMSGEFSFRTTGGDASLSDGPARLLTIQGRRIHTGVTEESIEMTVDAVPREEGEESITAEIDRDTFVAYVQTSGTTTLTYTNAWSANPSLYGITVTGDPVSGDKIIVVYVKENRGTIYTSNAASFKSTGWNLYNHTAGYARVKKYPSDFLVGGTYTALQFSETESGTKTSITPVSGHFNIPGDGYVWVTGGNNTDTYILMTWTNWTEGYPGEWEAYTEDVISPLGSSYVMYFPYGLCQVGSVCDELNFATGKAVSRIDCMEYTAANLATAKASGRDWEADTNWIYIVKEVPVSYNLQADGDYTAYDHGLEIIGSGTGVPVYVESLYGQNLVDKLRTDVVTKSQDLVNNLNTNDSTKALSAAQGYALNSNLIKRLYFSVDGNVSATALSNTGLYNTLVALPSIPQGSTFLGVIVENAYDNTFIDKNVFTSVYFKKLVIWASISGIGVHVDGYILYI